MELALVFLIGLGVSFFSSFMTGGLAIMSLTALLALGLSPFVALGTTRVGALGFSLGGVHQYFKAGKIAREFLPLMIVLGVTGAAIGINLILSVDESSVEKFIGFVILLFIPLTIWKPKLGLVRTAVTQRSKVFGYIAYFFSSVWGGAVGVGTGFWVLYSQMYFHGLTLLEVKGTNRIPGIIKSIIGVGIFAYYDLVNWEIGLVFAAGMFLGSLIGTKYAIKMGDGWLRYILMFTIALFSLKLILGY